MTRPRITLFTRDRCGLCHEALEALERVRVDAPFDLTVLDLDLEAATDTRAAYDLEVPVVELEGRKVMKYRVDEVRLRRLLTAQPEANSVRAESETPRGR